MFTPNFDLPYVDGPSRPPCRLVHMFAVPAGKDHMLSTPLREY